MRTTGDLLMNRTTVAKFRTEHLILVLGVLLLFPTLGMKTMWTDEVTIAYGTSGTLADTINSCKDYNATSVYPPLSPVLVYFAKQVADTDFMHRLPSALSGLALLVVFWLWVKSFLPRKIALTALALMVISPPLIYYSQEAKMYMQINLCTVAALYLACRILRSQGRDYVNFGLLVLVNAANLYLSYFAWVIIGNLFLCLLILLMREPSLALRERFRKASFLVFSYILVMVAYLPWLPQFLNTIGRHTTGPASHLAIVDARFVLELLLEVSGTGIAGISVFAFVLIGMVALTRSVKWEVCCGIFAFALSIAFIAIVKPSHPFYNRFYLFFHPLLVISAASGLCFLASLLSARSMPVRIIGQSCLALLLFGPCLYELGDYYVHERSGWKEASQYISKEIPHDTLLLAGTHYSNASMERYLFKGHPDLRERRHGPYFDYKQFTSFVKQKPKVWYATHAWSTHEQRTMEFIHDYFHLKKRCRGESEYFDVLIFERRRDKPVIAISSLSSEEDANWPSTIPLKSPMKEPLGLDVDESGLVYIADSQNNRIVVLSSEGREIRSWGREGSGPGEFKTPSDVAVAEDGNVWVTDMWNGRVQVFDEQGKFLRAVGRRNGLLGDSESGEFYGPRSIAIAEDGSVFVVDTGHCLVWKFNSDGDCITSWGGKGEERGKFDEPVGVAVIGNLLAVADSRNQRIQRFDLNGVFGGEAMVDAWDSDWCSPFLAIMADGRMLATDSTSNVILVKERENESLMTVLKSSGGDFETPIGLAIGPGQAIYVSEKRTGRIRKLILTDSD